jgi:hypothetical protein
MNWFQIEDAAVRKDSAPACADQTPSIPGLLQYYRNDHPIRFTLPAGTLKMTAATQIPSS